MFSVNAERMFRFNMLPEIMVASRQDATVVGEGARLAGTRAIPLYISRSRLGEALSALGEKPLFEVLPLRKAKVGILVTGTEVFRASLRTNSSRSSRPRRISSTVRWCARSLPRTM